MFFWEIFPDVYKHNRKTQSKIAVINFGNKIMSSNTLGDKVFQYTGSETIPKDVTILNFHCSVTDIENWAFEDCTDLKKVVLNNGLHIVHH